MQRSNDSELRGAGVKNQGGAIWLTESSLPEPATLFTHVVDETTANPAQSGYGSVDPVGLAQADETAAIGGLATNAITITRLYAQLPRAALATDLQVGASNDQSSVLNTKLATHVQGYPMCGQKTLGCSSSYGLGGGGNGADASSSSGCSCSLTSERGSKWGALLGAALVGLSLGRARRSRSAAKRRSS